MAGTKVATMVLGASTTTRSGFDVTFETPLHPSNCQPTSGIAVSVTTASRSYFPLSGLIAPLPTTDVESARLTAGAGGAGAALAPAAAGPVGEGLSGSVAAAVEDATPAGPDRALVAPFAGGSADEPLAGPSASAAGSGGVPVAALATGNAGEGLVDPAAGAEAEGAPPAGVAACDGETLAGLTASVGEGATPAAAAGPDGAPVAPFARAPAGAGPVCPSTVGVAGARPVGVSGSECKSLAPPTGDSAGEGLAGGVPALARVLFSRERVSSRSAATSRAMWFRATSPCTHSASTARATRSPAAARRVARRCGGRTSATVTAAAPAPAAVPPPDSDASCADAIAVATTAAAASPSAPSPATASSAS